QLIIIALVTLVLTSTGCIDTYLGKEMFGERVEYEKYKVVGKAEMSYEFETTTEPASTEYSDSINFSIKKETAWIHIMVDYHQALGLPNPLHVYRHLTVTVFSPDGKECKNKTYTDTDEDVIVIEQPVSGIWNVEIESEGIGYPALGHDSFTVTVTAKEPV
ncbi:MAG: hypothetical protein KJ655_04020, partial [Candidatus Thermoplasmatota archaeon]|nr:hypothetical protein [Candidatus Thermoplasmatota archaeon]